MIHLYTTSDQENYCKLLKPIFGSTKVRLFFENPLTWTQVHLSAKAANATTVIVCNTKLLSLLLNKVDAIQKKEPSLDDYAGSLIHLDGIDYLVCNPPSHLVITSTGYFLWSRYVSKIIKSTSWPAQPSFKWVLGNAGNVEKYYTDYFLDCDLIAVDIETVSEPTNTITCCVFSAVKFGVPDGTAPYSILNFVLPVAYADKGEHPLMLAWLRKFCDLPIPKVFQNGKYDNAWLIFYHSPVRNWLLDTAHMFHSWFSELPKRLDFIASFCVREVSYWKSDISGDRESYFRYNAKDGYYTAIAAINILNEWPGWAESNFKSEFPLVFPCLLAELTGIRGSRAKFEDMRQHTEVALDRQKKELGILTATPDFNPNSPKQTLALFHILGCKDAKGTGKIERDRVAARHPLNRYLLDKIGKYRETGKLLSSYLKEGILTTGDRILYCLNPHGTDTGRLSSKESHFWCGLQIQNIPRDKEEEDYNVKEFFVADEGFYIGECDRKQAESYGTAYITGDETLLAAVNGTKDFHGLNASRFFGVDYEKIVSPEGKTLDKPLRDLSKRTNHGANYMMGAQVLLDTMGIQRVLKAKQLLKLPAIWSPLQTTAYLLQCFESTYPTIRGAYANWVKSTVAGTHMLVGATGWTRYCFEDPTKSKHAWNSYVAHGAQSLNAMELNFAWLRVFNEIALPNPTDFKLCAQIHDSILFQYRKGRLDLAKKVRECMENSLVVKDFRGKERVMLIPADLSGEAECWAETKKIPK